MLLKIPCLTVFSNFFALNHVVLEQFNDISDLLELTNVPDLTFGLNFRLSNTKQKVNDYAVKVCAEKCLELPYFCHSFMLIGHVEQPIKICRLNSMLSSIDSGSQLPPRTDFSVLALYERKNVPTAQDLIRRFSLEDPKVISNTYGIPHYDSKFTTKVLNYFELCLQGKLPTAVNIEKWLQGTELSKCQIDLGKEYERGVIRGLHLWKTWPVNKDAPVEFSDIIVLTFLNIFFKSLGHDITTVFDSTGKMLIVEGPRIHMLVQSFGPGDYVIFTADNSWKNFIWQHTVDTRSQPDEDVLQVFQRAMQRFGHKIVLGKTTSFRLNLVNQNKLEWGVFTIVSAIGHGLFNPPPRLEWYAFDVVNVLQRDIVTAVIAKVLENSPKLQFQSTLHRTLQGTNFQSKMFDFDVITQE